MILQLGVKHSIYTVSTRCCNTLLHFVGGKELELMLKTLNAWKTLHCRDFRNLSTLRSTCGKYIDIT